ncbi:hypothetical protein [Kangiella koreensis]|uniref:Uncharacterized protein n=1 Tax=Kangiella koreensis (strain DSM 16069 / JCM 12317 / KCTC 12182 / SW-125) TaxID=523791 RepID=C7R9F1_KANKD|nr:hypothetical protein [Kangiella koreensis]ACV26042.1 hypothetical protein Kkor_0622 [Kangiella koreensis DSM 16069]
MKLVIRGITLTILCLIYTTELLASTSSKIETSSTSFNNWMVFQARDHVWVTSNTNKIQVSYQCFDIDKLKTPEGIESVFNVLTSKLELKLKNKLPEYVFDNTEKYVFYSVSTEYKTNKFRSSLSTSFHEFRHEKFNKLIVHDITFWQVLQNAEHLEINLQVSKFNTLKDPPFERSIMEVTEIIPMEGFNEAIKLAFKICKIPPYQST